MEEWIKKSDVVKAIISASNRTYRAIEQNRTELTMDYLHGLDDAIQIIKDAPSADRPQGEWIYCEDEYGIDGYRCSNCGRHIPWDYQHKFINFIDDYHTCPFCDARMKGADDEVR